MKQKASKPNARITCIKVWSLNILSINKTSKRLSGKGDMDYSCIVNLSWFNFILGLNFIFLYFWEQWCMVMSLKQKKVQFKPRIKLNHNKSIKKTTDIFNVTLRQQKFLFFPNNWLDIFPKSFIVSHKRKSKTETVMSNTAAMLWTVKSIWPYIQYKLSALLTVCFWAHKKHASPYYIRAQCATCSIGTDPHTRYTPSCHENILSLTSKMQFADLKQLFVDHR